MSNIYDDPFGTVLPASESNSGVAKVRARRSLLPVALLVACFASATMPWVLLRPFGDDRRGFNVTDVPGGMGIIWTLVLVSIPGLILFVAGRRSGLIVMGIAAGVLGWMATISGLLLGIITAIVPSIELAGIDMARTQVGQGYGVPATVLTSLILGFIAVQSLQQDSEAGSTIRVPITPIVALVPLVLLAINHHNEWLRLGSDAASIDAAVPGDSMYGSGLLLIGMWIAVGTWMIALVLRQRFVTMFAATLSVVVAGVSFVYSILVWFGGKALGWLLPQSIEGWTSIGVAAGLYVTMGSSIVLFVAAALSFAPVLSTKSVDVKTSTKLGGRTTSTSNLVGGLILVSVIAYTIVRATT